MLWCSQFGYRTVPSVRDPIMATDIEEFDEATKQQFMDEDSEAWNSICAILMGIILVGLALACLAVYLVS